MQRIHLARLGITAVLAAVIGTVGFVSSATAQPSTDTLSTTSTSASSSGGCLVPSLTTVVFWETSEIVVELSDDERTCSKQCRDLRRGCRKVATASQKCADAGFKGFVDMFKRNCMELGSADRRICLAELSEFRAEFRDFLREDILFAAQDCEDMLSECNDFCEDGPV